MNDWVSHWEMRNYKIERRTDARKLKELLWITSTLLILAAVSVFYAWQRSQIVALGYEHQRLQQVWNAQAREEKALILEEETLKNPERIDDMARSVLGMAPIQAQQLLSPYPTDPENRTSIALAESLSLVPERKKRSIAP